MFINLDSSHVSAKKTTPTKSEVEKKNPNNMRRLRISKVSVQELLLICAYLISNSILSWYQLRHVRLNLCRGYIL